jgi:ribokinase
MYDFITIGGTTRDISFFTAEGLLINNYNRDLLHQHVLAFESGAKIKVDKFYYSYGGGAANAAVCLANFDFKTACLAPVGQDEDGQMIIKNLAQHHVATPLIQRVPKEESGSSFILISPAGERIIFAQRGANNKLKINRTGVAALKKAKNIYIASLAGRWPAELKKIFAAVQPGQQVFWNPGMTQYLDGVSAIAGYMKKVTVLASNKDEATELILTSQKHRRLGRAFLSNPENLVKILHSFGPKIAVITLGSAGVIAYDGLRLYRREIIKETKTVDTTGVGDIFNATFAAGLVLFAGDIDKALHLSLQNTAAKVAHIGAQTGLIKI